MDRLVPYMQEARLKKKERPSLVLVEETTELGEERIPIGYREVPRQKGEREESKKSWDDEGKKNRRGSEACELFD